MIYLSNYEKDTFDFLYLLLSRPLLQSIEFTKSKFNISLSKYPSMKRTKDTDSTRL